MNVQPRTKNNLWIWYVALLLVLSVASAVSLIVYNIRQQLRPEELEAAKARWVANGPRDYDMKYTKQLATTETFEVKVRAGKVIEVRLDGNLLEERLNFYHSMPALFSYVKRFLEMDAEPGRPRTFTIAAFDEKDGHLRHFIRRVTGTSERVEIVVLKFAPLSKETDQR